MVMIGYRDSGKCQHHYEDRGGAVLGKQWSQRSTSSSVSLSAAQHWHSVNTLPSIAQLATMSSQARWRYQARSHLEHIFWWLTHRHAPPSNLYMSDLDSWLDSTPF